MVGVLTVLAALVIGAVLGLLWAGRRARMSAGEINSTPPADPDAEVYGAGIVGSSADVAASVGEEPPGAQLAASLVAKALADLRLGVVVFDGQGEELYRNLTAEEFKTARHGNALTEAAIERVVEGALIGLSLEESLDLYGPPQRSLRVQASPSLDGDQITGVTAVVEDVTEARHAERVRSDFVANVSHELRTPVGAMSVLAETLADCDDDAVAARLTARIQREAVRMSQTIADLLVLSRLDAGAVTASDTTDLASVVSMAIDRVSEVATQRGVDIVVDNTESGPVLVDGEQGQLVSAVANLLDNAIKYSDVPYFDPLGISEPVGGSRRASDERLDATVTVSLAIEGGSSSTDRPEAVMSVADQGIGVPEADLNRIFERFYRVDNARSRDTGGTGLGLSIVRNTVMNHGGTIDVDSVEGRGSTFTVRLPLSPAQLQLDSTPTQTDVEAGNGRP